MVLNKIFLPVFSLYLIIAGFPESTYNQLSTTKNPAKSTHTEQPPKNTPVETKMLEAKLFSYLTFNS